MRVEVFRSIKEIPSCVWDSLLKRDETFMSHRYLTLVEETSPEDYEFWYLLVYDGDKLAASMPLFRMPVFLDLLSTGVARKAIKFLRRFYKNFFIIKPLIGGCPPSLGNNNLLISKEADIVKVLSALNDSVETIAKENRIGLIGLKEFEPMSSEQLAPLIPKGFIKASSLPTNKLTLVGSSFEEYLKALRTPYRQSINANLRKLEKGGIEVKVLYDFSEVFDDYCYSLYEAVINKAEFQLERLTPEFFRKMSELPENEAALVTLCKDGTILGYFLVCNSGVDSISAMFAGINYEYSRQYDIYFNLFYQVIKLAYARNKNIVEFGQNSYQLKSRLGCKQIPLDIFIKHTNRGWHYILSRLTHVLFPKYELKEKNAFRERGK
ncbi:MAG: GNAT family N-acetyltransferase [Clostridia bacterium]|nr:GNAT family N-acetyltransferase [Clostridia bacterium]